MHRTSLLLTVVCTALIAHAAAAEARNGRRPGRGTQIWQKIVRDRTVTQLHGAMAEQPTMRWSRGKMTMNLGDLQAIAPQINRAFRGGNWNPTIRKQLRRINKMDSVMRDGDTVMGVNRDSAGKLSLVRSIKWREASSGAEVKTLSLLPRLLSRRVNYAGNPHSHGALHVYLTTPLIGKRMPKGLRKLISDTQRNSGAEVSRLPTRGDRTHYNTFRERGKGTTHETSVMSPPGKRGLRDSVLRLVEKR